jgi:Bacterial Ig-like domain (group 2)
MTPISSAPPPTLASIAISPSTASLSVGQTKQFTATGTDSDGTGKDVTTSVTWSSSNANVVTISASGLATATGAGSATITAVSSVDASKSAGASVAAAYTGMLIYHNDLARTGQNPNETILTPSNVNSAQFGKLFSYPLDGGTYAQPLYVQSVAVGNQGVHNVVYVATAHDSVYAFDADGKVSTPLWHVSFINPSTGITAVPPPLDDDAFPGGEIGIIGTPVIDPASGTLYVVSYTLENGKAVYRLHALDLGTGAEKLGGPAVISATVAGIGDGTDGQGHLPFDPTWHLQRQALLLLNGVIYIGFASHGDIRPYHGWLLAYDATTLKQTAAYNDSPNGAAGGIWESGCGPSVDADGNIYLATGNGTFDASTGGLDYGDSILKLDPASLRVLDWFAPFNQATLNAVDQDLGSGGVMLLPDQPGLHPHLLVVAGKEGRIYLLDRDNLGHYGLMSDSAVQELAGQINANDLSTPAYWQGNIYYASEDDALKMFSLKGGLLSSSPVAKSQVTYGHAGATVSISANGSRGGIVWANNTSAFATGGPAQLYAYDAMDVSHELYDSKQAGSRDTLGTANKFAVPTVINGNVYVGTATELDVFGLLGGAP